MSLDKQDGYSLDKNIHFTYKPEIDKDSLCQGDILMITEELKDVLKEIHPYFLNKQYEYFMVLSQSCDLVQRTGNRCKTPYITLAAIRKYSSFLERIITRDKYAEAIGGLFLMDEKNLTRIFPVIERLYNNTEPEYFFLYKEQALDFPDPMVAYLKVSIALKSYEHYDKCLNAKKIELTDEFKAKLGWLVGNMYSRVGTADWQSSKTDEEKIENINKDIASKCVIGSKEQLNKLKIEIKTNSEVYDHEVAAEYISGLDIKSKYDNAMEVIEDIINTSSKKIPLEEKENLIKKFKSRSTLKTLLS